MNNDAYQVKSIVIMLYMFVILFSVVTLGYSPLLGFYIPLCFLLFGLGYDRKFRFLLSFIAIIGASFTFASRNFVSGTIKDDFANVYLPAYYDVTNGGSIFYEQYSGGVEFFITLYFKIINDFFGNLSPPTIIFSIVFLVFILYYVWLERFIVRLVSPKYRSLLIATCLSLVTVIVFTQNMRQAISCVFVLFAINYFLEKKNILWMFFLCMATISHTSSLIVFPLFLTFLGNSRKAKIVIVLACLSFLLLFNVAISFIISNSLLGASTYKLLYYTDVTGRSVDIGYLKFLIISLLASFFFFDKNNDDLKKYKNLLYYGTAIYIILMPIPTLSFRFLMLLVVFYNGVLLFFSFSRSLNLLVIIIGLYSFYRFLTLGPYQTILDGPDAYMNLWYSYQWVGDQFFYYIK